MVKVVELVVDRFYMNNILKMSYIYFFWDNQSQSDLNINMLCIIESKIADHFYWQQDNCGYQKNSLWIKFTLLA